MEEIRTYLQGLELPASKLDVIATAEANGAPHEVLELLQRLGSERIESVADVEAGVRDAQA